MVEKINVQRIELTKEEIRKAYEHALQMLSKEFPRINENDFIDTYGEEKIRKILEGIRKKESNFTVLNTKGNQRGVIFEAIFFDLLQNFWFESNDFKFIRSSKHDDYHNGVDAILSKKSSTTPSAMGISIDPTTSLDSLRKKSLKINENNGLTNIDFFTIPKSNFQGKLTGIPHIAIYLDDTTFTQLTRLWFNFKLTNLSKNLLDNLKSKIEHHTAQIDILKQIIFQLKFTLKKLENRNDDVSTSAKGIILNYLKILEPILSNKEFKISKYLEKSGESKEEIKDVLNNLPGLEKVKEIFH